jgi:hypothetical protein
MQGDSVAENRRHNHRDSDDRSDVQAMVREVARLRAVVDELASAMQTHSDAVRALADAVQLLTATRHKP